MRNGRGNLGQDKGRFWGRGNLVEVVQGPWGSHLNGEPFGWCRSQVSALLVDLITYFQSVNERNSLTSFPSRVNSKRVTV